MVDRVQDIYDDIWQKATPAKLPQDRMIHIMNLTFVDLKRYIEGSIQPVMWLGDFLEVKDSLTDAIGALCRLRDSILQLTEQIWPNASGNLWSKKEIGMMKELGDLINRMKQASTIITIIAYTYNILLGPSN